MSGRIKEINTRRATHAELKQNAFQTRDIPLGRGTTPISSQCAAAIAAVTNTLRNRIGADIIGVWMESMNGLDKNHCIVLKEGKFDLQAGFQPEDLEALFANVKKTNSERLVLHFHGGLIDRAAGLSAASALKPIYEAAGAYPLFVIWESGWKEVLQQNLPDIFQENIFQKIQSRVTQFAKGKIAKENDPGTAKGIGGMSVPKESLIQEELDNPADGREPFSGVDPTLPLDAELTEQEREQFEQTLNKDVFFGNAVAEIAIATPPGTAPVSTSKGITVRGSTKTLMSPDVLDELTTAPDGSKGLISTAAMAARVAMVLARVIRRFAQKRDHGFYLTIVEEILRAFYVGNAGKFLWDGMKQDIEEAFGFAPGLGGNDLIEQFKSLAEAGVNPKITIVGHSAGAIYACRLLQEISRRKLPADRKFNVIFIAPACTFTLLAAALREAGDRIAELRIFGMGDDLERRDAIVKVVYPSSLLYFVSGVIEEERDCPLAGMQRYYVAPYNDTEAFPDIAFVKSAASFKKDNVLVWANSTAGEGINCDMTSHGGWAARPATVASVQWIINKGFGNALATGS